MQNVQANGRKGFPKGNLPDHSMGIKKVAPPLLMNIKNVAPPLLMNIKTLALHFSAPLPDINNETLPNIKGNIKQNF